VFKNHGEKAGASMSHSHSHILALPIIPPSVSARLANMKDYFYQTGKCCICEIQSEELLIDSSTYFFSLVPFAASLPFEIWIVPRNHSAHFHELDAEMVTLHSMQTPIYIDVQNMLFDFNVNASHITCEN
jgi:UDPglucose--hexose-1-phosphate uridylyltransferase